MVMTNEEHVLAILDRTFKVLHAVYKSQSETVGDFRPLRMNRIIFPKNRKLSQRVSEQELRFTFVEQLYEEIRQGWDVFYSVETPTLKEYSGFSKGKPECGKGGRSGAIDLVIHDNKSRRLVIIEFKAHTAEEKDYKKDLYKLVCENAECKFFVNILKNVKSTTCKSIHDKIETYIESDIKYVFWSLTKNRDVTKDIIEYK